MASSVWSTVEKWEYVALPLLFSWVKFYFARGFPKDFSRRWFPGCTDCPAGLLLMNIVSCTLFAAVSGSSAATTATVGRITLAEFDKLGI